MIKEKKPKVSVILPVYNGEEYLQETIDSVLSQDYTDYEFLIINDGSRDASQDIIDKNAKIDSRIVSIKQKNQGLVKTLNKGIDLAKGIYIARIDADDVWLRGKLKEQVKELDQDEDLVLIGGSFDVVDEKGGYIRTFYAPIEDSHIKDALLLYNPFGHAGVVYRKDAVIKAGLYSGDVGPTEDYDLWIKLSRIGKLKNLARPIFRYRENENGISQTNHEYQLAETRKHAEKLWREYATEVKSRREIKEMCEKYLNSNDPGFRRIAQKEQYLYDCTGLGIKMIRHGRAWDGLAQLLNVASTGRSGVRSVKTKLKSIDRGSFKQLNKK